MPDLWLHRVRPGVTWPAWTYSVPGCPALTGPEPQDEPVIVFVVGQQGAGKSRIAEMVADRAYAGVLDLADVIDREHLADYAGVFRRGEATPGTRPARARGLPFRPPRASIASVFTIEQIEELHERLGSAKTLAEYVRSLAGIGVVRYVSYVSDGHSEYFGHDGRRVMSQPVHDQLPVAADSDREAFLEHLGRHERGQTSYLEMSKALADSGVRGWTVDTHAMTMTFHGPSGQALLTEPITPTEAS